MNGTLRAEAVKWLMSCESDPPRYSAGGIGDSPACPIQRDTPDAFEQGCQWPNQ